MEREFHCRTIFFDIDNTLFDHVNNTIPESVDEAFCILKECGCRLCLATGRELESIPASVQDYYEWDGYVTSNGQYLYNKKKELIRRENLSKEIVKRCIKIAEATQTTLDCKTERGNFVLNFYTPHYFKLYDFFGLKPWKIDTIQEDDKIIALMAARESGNYDDFARVDGVVVFPSEDGYADINLKGSSKYKGIMNMLTYMGERGYIAFGDADNDYEMLKHAELSIVMGNASQKLREIASFVTEKAGEDGILKGIKWLMTTVYTPPIL